MSISALFPGMEAYLDGDVEINNNVTTPEEDAAHEVEAADQTADIATDAGEVETDVKNDDVATQMLLRTGRLYYHVKKYGVDRTFLRLYNQHGEMDRMCGIQFPSCESMNTTGNPYSRYSAAFIAAMEDEKEGFWAKIWQKIQDGWKWLKDHIAALWDKILQFFGVRARDLQKLISEIEQKYDTNSEITLPEKGKLGTALDTAHTPSSILEARFSSIHDPGSEVIGSLARFETTNELQTYAGELDSKIIAFKNAVKATPDKGTAVSVPNKVVLNKLLAPLKAFVTTANDCFKKQDQLKKDSENALKRVAKLVNDNKNNADANLAKVVGEIALKATNFVKEINGAIVTEGKNIISTTNAYYKELRSVVKQLKPKDQPKEKPADNAGGDASDKSGGDKNATAMFAFL